jgi:hypothetical protein
VFFPCSFPSPCCCRPFLVLCKVFFPLFLSFSSFAKKKSLSFLLVFCNFLFSFFPSSLSPSPLPPLHLIFCKKKFLFLSFWFVSLSTASPSSRLLQKKFSFVPSGFFSLSIASPSSRLLQKKNSLLFLLVSLALLAPLHLSTVGPFLVCSIILFFFLSFWFVSLHCLPFICIFFLSLQ